MRECALGVVVAMLAVGLPAQANARVEGVVLDPLARPVGNAEITVEVDGDVVARTRTDGQGVFVVGRCSAGRCVVRATTDAPDVGAVDVAVDGHAYVVVRTMPARRVTGIVRDAEGAAVAGAWVAIAPGRARELAALGTHTRTDGAGAFAFDHVPYDIHGLAAYAPGHAGGGDVIDGEQDCHVDLTLADEVTDPIVFEVDGASAEQRAAARLSVTARTGHAVYALPPEVRTPARDADGRWRVRGWPTDITASLWIPDACLDPWRIEVTAHTRRRERTFYVEQGDDTVVRGRLTDRSGRGLGDVSLLGCRVDADGPPAREVATTLADGTFSLRSPSPRGSGFLLRSGSRRWVLRQETHRLADEGDNDGVAVQHTRHDLHLTAVPAHTLRGRVQDAEGTPLPGADVALLLAERFEVSRGNRRHVGFRHRIATVLWRGHTDGDGGWEFRELPHEPRQNLVLQVVHADGFVEVPFGLDDGPSTDLGAMRLTAPRSLRGVVVDPAGDRVPGAVLAIESWSGFPMRTMLATDRDGRFRVTGLRPGPCVVDPLAGTRAVVVHLTAEGEAEVEIELTPP